MMDFLHFLSAVFFFGGLIVAILPKFLCSWATTILEDPKVAVTFVVLYALNMRFLLLF